MYLNAVCHMDWLDKRRYISDSCMERQKEIRHKCPNDLHRDPLFNRTPFFFLSLPFTGFLRRRFLFRKERVLGVRVPEVGCLHVRVKDINKSRHSNTDQLTAESRIHRKQKFVQLISE